MAGPVMQFWQFLAGCRPQRTPLRSASPEHEDEAVRMTEPRTLVAQQIALVLRFAKRVTVRDELEAVRLDVLLGEGFFYSVQA